MLKLSEINIIIVLSNLFPGFFEVPSYQASNLECLHEVFVIMFSQQEVVADKNSTSDNIVESMMTDLKTMKL
jgi:hypothetical protein